VKVVIPAAGIGKRLRPFTYTKPKALLPVAGKPIIAHIINGLRGLPIEEVVIVIGYMGEKIKEYFKGFKDFKISYAVQQEPEGLGHAVYQARTFIDDAPLLIILGDTVFDVDYQKFTEGEEGTIGVKEVDNPDRFGVAELNGDIVERVVEKPENPSSNLAIVGIYYFPFGASLFDAIEENIENNKRTKGEIQLTDAIQLMIDRGEVLTVEKIQGWFDCGKVETLIGTNRYLLSKGNFHPNIPGAFIIPPVYIGDNTQVKNVVLGPYVSIGEGASIKDAIIRNSIIDNGAELKGVLMENSFIGENVRMKSELDVFVIGDNSEIRKEEI